MRLRWTLCAAALLAAAGARRSEQDFEFDDDAVSQRRRRRRRRSVDTAPDTNGGVSSSPQRCVRPSITIQNYLPP